MTDQIMITIIATGFNDDVKEYKTLRSRKRRETFTFYDVAEPERRYQTRRTGRREN